MTTLRLISLALVVTLLLGGWMRWAFAGAWPFGLDFNHLRHAHSHLGAYGVLFPLSFLAWKQLGAPSPGPKLLVAYAVATLVAVIGFLRAGYGPEAIAGSTVVGAIWLTCAFRLRGAMRQRSNPLALVPPALVGAMACVPLIALNVRRDPAYAQEAVATFLAVLLLVAVTPSALAAIGVRAWFTPVLTLSGLMGAASLGLAPSMPMRAGLTVYAAWLTSVAFSRTLDWTLRLSWGLVGAGLLAMSFKLVPNVRPSVIGALHLLILGPVLLSLSRRVWPKRSALAEAVLLAGVALLSGPLVAQAFGVVEHTMRLSAVGGTVVAAWWTWAAVKGGARE